MLVRCAGRIRPDDHRYVRHVACGHRRRDHRRRCGQTGAQLCALVSVADAQAATKASPAFSTQKNADAGSGEIECVYGSNSTSGISIATVDYTLGDDDVLDLRSGPLGNLHPTSVTVAGHQAFVVADRAGTANETEVVLGDQHLDVFTVSHTVPSAQLSALAAVFVAKL